jgi:hypothetical protein
VGGLGSTTESGTSAANGGIASAGATATVGNDPTGGHLLPPGTQYSQTTFTTTQTPLILLGLFSALQAQSARPYDRVFVDYGYFDEFRVLNPLTGGTQNGFNLNMIGVGGEKTLFDGNASIYVRVPFLLATANVTGQPIDGLGDVTAGFKYVLLQCRETGSALTAGMSVAAPTARDQVVSSTTATVNSYLFTPATHNIPLPVSAVLNSPAAGPFQVPQSVTTMTTVNPTFLQPWVAGLWAHDRFFIQDYFGVVVPTDDRVATLINDSLSMGYQVYRGGPECILSSITPTLGVQVLEPLNHQGIQTSGPATTVPNGVAGTPFNTIQISTPPSVPPINSFGFPTQVFISAGSQFGLCSRALLSAAVVTPVVGPKAFTVGATVGFNFFF